MSHRQEKVEGRLQEIIARYLNNQAGTKSVLTVTHCDVSSDLKRVTAYVSIFPEQFETEALNFAKRQRAQIREIIAQELPMKTIPFVEIEVDEGEKNRQKIDRTMLGLDKDKKA